MVKVFMFFLNGTGDAVVRLLTTGMDRTTPVLSGLSKKKLKEKLKYFSCKYLSHTYFRSVNNSTKYVIFINEIRNYRLSEMYVYQ